MADRYAPAYRFKVLLGNPLDDPVAGRVFGEGAFQECTGLDLEMEVFAYPEGGRNNGPLQLVGRAKSAPLVLKRGMVYASEGRVDDDGLWRWMQSILEGRRPVRRIDGTVSVLAPDSSTSLGAWHFQSALPAKIVGPQLNARTGEIAMEELHLAHQGLRLGSKV